MQQLRFLAFLLATASLVHAQEKDADGKSRMYFFPEEKKQEEPAKKQPEKKPSGKIATPDERINAFFAALQKEKIDEAYDTLVKDSMVADRKEDVTSLKQRTQQALDGYGPIAGYELIEEKSVGTHLMRRTCLSLNSDLPLRWRFYFYESDGQWRLIDLRVDDALVELFEDSAKAKK